MLRVKELLKERGLTAKELAKQLGIAEASLSMQIKNGANPTLSSLEKIAKALDVPVYDLFEKPHTLNGTVTCPHCGKPIELCVK
ncbi:MAG: helix-turn-helix domain-containing protein [Bacteroidales bacterium]|nr:helix-turn-helix domain-containing protein [Bacteroidales bacterium]